MPTTQLPLMKGAGKDFRSADYVDLLPVNLLATPKEVLNSAGYMRSFPGLVKHSEVDGVSRGVQFNNSRNKVYRVLGTRLYSGDDDIGGVGGTSRVSMAYSATSQAIAIDGDLKLYRYDGNIKTLSNWSGSDYEQYQIGAVRDVCRLRGRYIWVKDGTDTFGITDLEDESHPDRYRAMYRAESQPDGIMGCGVWRDFVVMFGTATIEYFSLTGSSDASAAIYVSQPSLMVSMGIAGTYCKTPFAGSHAFLSHPSSGSPSIYTINAGQASSIATSSIEKIIRTYSADELARCVMESVRFDSHELLLVHLPRHVLCYDAAASGTGPQWAVMKSDLDDEPYRAIDFMYEGNEIRAADKKEGLVASLDFTSSSQYGQPAEHLLYTPLFKADNARVFDFELESSTGISQQAERLFVSATVDGINYGREQMISSNSPFKYDRRVLWRRIGRVRKNIGFKVRVITRSPVTLSGASVRVE
ncbi:TPA: hypothetical protein NV922_001276 [Escherichia coli]|nr:hypothetical protein [Escherichia coli]